MSNIYQDLIEEIKTNISDIEIQLVTFRKLLRQSRNGKFNLDREKLRSIVFTLNLEKEQLKCSIQLYQSILPKRKELLLNKKNMEL